MQGLHDFIVVESNNTLLICPRDQEQNVKQVVADVKDKFGTKYIKSKLEVESLKSDLELSTQDYRLDLWRIASYNITPVDTETFSDSISPNMGIFAK